MCCTDRRLKSVDIWSFQILIWEHCSKMFIKQIKTLNLVVHEKVNVIYILDNIHIFEGLNLVI